MYNTIYIFLKLTCPICKKKLKHISWQKQKHFFKTKDLASIAKKRLSGVISKNILKLGIPDTRSWLYISLKLQIILLFNNIFIIRSAIILIVIFSLNSSVLGFKFKTGLHVAIYHLSLATYRGEWLLRMILSVCLFKNAYGTNQQHKLKLKK